MNSFCNSTSFHQSAFMIFAFLALVLCLCNSFALSYRQKSKRLRILNASVFSVLFALDAGTGHAFWCMRKKTAYRELLPAPMWALWCIAVLSFVILIYECVILMRGRNRGLHRDSVKQAMDTLPSAICYFTPEGTVKLCNLQMHRLFRSIAGSDLQTLAEFYRGLADCERFGGITKLSEERQTYLFPDGKAWHYSETKVTASDGITYTEAMFSDVTELYEDSLKLKEQTKRLEQISSDLKLLSYNAQTAAKEQEILFAKTALHDQMGAGVLAVRRILQSGKADEAAFAVELFQKAVSIIKNDNERPPAVNELSEFLHDAESIGVNVILIGRPPECEKISHAFVLAMRECLTNGVRHADCDEIRITITQSKRAAELQITNNGAVPKGRITAKGGLKNIERYVTNLNGSMDIQSEPAFMLNVTIPFSEERA